MRGLINLCQLKRENKRCKNLKQAQEKASNKGRVERMSDEGARSEETVQATHVRRLTLSTREAKMASQVRERRREGEGEHMFGVQESKREQ
jgi:hypothetical protein